MQNLTSAKLPYHPSYWLASLGAGGLSVSFFMYLMWLLPHPDTPVPTWVHLKGVWARVDGLPAGVPAVVILATLAMLLLAGLHFVLLVWNIRQYRAEVNQESLIALHG